MSGPRRKRTDAGADDAARGRPSSSLSAYPLAPAALDAALRQVGFAAFVVGRGGRVLHANPVGWRFLERDPEGTRRRLAASVSHPEVHGEFTARQFEVGSEPHYLVIRRPAVVTEEERVHAAVQRWGLTRRQSEVLEEVTRGRSNGQIAERLACSVATVEVHITRILEKSGCLSRAELVARVCTEPAL